MPKSPRRPFGFENLERREMLSGDSPYISIFLSGGELSVLASKNPAEMVADVTSEGNLVKVVAQAKNDFGSWSGESKTFLRSDVNSLVIKGTKGNDRLNNLTDIPSTISGLGGSNTIQGGSAADVIFGGGGWTDRTTVRGGAGNDQIFGGNGHDTLFGDAGIDRLNGGEGNDWMDGGASSDFFVYGTQDHLGYQQGNDTIADSRGNNRIDLRQLALNANIDLQNQAWQQVSPGHLNLKLEPTTRVQVVLGTRFDDIIRGNALDNRLFGGGGNDTLEGRAGNDILNGGLGNDMYEYNGTNLGSDTISNAQGDTNGIDFRNRPMGNRIDLLDTRVQKVADDLSIRLVSSRVVNWVRGSAYDDDIRGSDRTDTLIGSGGSDRLEGRGGNDFLDTGAGNDFVVFSGNKHLGIDSFLNSQGANTLDFRNLSRRVQIDLESTSQQVVANGLKLTLDSSSAFFRVLGTAYNDVLRGNELGNILAGYSGYDQLEGRGGNDYLFGGNDNDRFVFRGQALGTDRITGTTHGRNQLDFSKFDRSVAIDLAKTGLQVVSAANLSLIMESSQAISHVLGSRGDDIIKGNSKPNILKGNGGNDTLYGRGANDRLFGGAGDDGLYGGNGKDEINGGGGSDRLLFQAGDRISDNPSSNDAVLRFVDGTNHRTGGVKKWQSQEIEKLDIGFRQVHIRVTTRFLKANNGKDLIFIRDNLETDSTQPRTVLAANGKSTENIWVYDPAFKANISPQQTIVHELGHEWDEPQEGPLFGHFVKFSGWRYVNNRWTHAANAVFARSYGATNPYEDIATSWGTYFFGSQAEKQRLVQKIQDLDLFFEWYLRR